MRRVARTAGSATTVYFQSGQQTIADYTAGTAASSPAYTYVYASYIDEPVMRASSGGSVKHYYHRNSQYSITALTDSSGTVVERYAYTAYGTPTITDASGTMRTTTAVGNRYTYTGREWGETLALYHYRARMYDPVGGRFVSRDPIGFEGSKWNGYEYVNAKTMVKVDPSGLHGNGGATWACCGKQTINISESGCCDKKPYDLETECCQKKTIVQKVEIQVCRRRLGGDDSSIPFCGPISHTFIICPDGRMVGKHPRPFSEEGSNIQGPGYINEEKNDLSKAACKPKKVCPSDAERMCKEGETDAPYNILCTPGYGTNCHSWGNGNSW